MHGGGNDDDHNKSSKKEYNKEKQTLIPMTIKMFNDATINHSDTLEYEGIPLHEVIYKLLT